MDRIVLDGTIEVGKEVLIKGPPLEALRFQGARAGSIVTLTDPEGNDFRGRVIHLSEDNGIRSHFRCLSFSDRIPSGDCSPSGPSREGANGADHPEGD